MTTPTPSLLSRAFSTAVRVLLILGLAAVGLLLFQSYRDLFTSAPVPPGPRTDTGAPDSLRRFHADLLLDGSWSFDEDNWALRRTEADDKLVAAAFTREAPPASPSPPSELEKEALAYVRSGKGKGDGEYALGVGEARVRAVTSGRGAAERLRLVVVAWPGEGERWSLLEIAPVAGGKQGEARLLPPRPGDRTLARRWRPDGTLGAELRRLGGGTEKALADWREGGWSHTKLYDLEGGGAGRLLRRGEAGVIVWDLPGGKGGPLDGCALMMTAPGPDEERP